jgi:hypothetical protein
MRRTLAFLSVILLFLGACDDSVSPGVGSLSLSSSRDTALTIGDTVTVKFAATGAATCTDSVAGSTADYNLLSYQGSSTQVFGVDSIRLRSGSTMPRGRTTFVLHIQCSDGNDKLVKRDSVVFRLLTPALTSVGLKPDSLPGNGTDRLHFTAPRCAFTTSNGQDYTGTRWGFTSPVVDVAWVNCRDVFSTVTTGNQGPAPFTVKIQNPGGPVVTLNGRYY